MSTNTSYGYCETVVPLLLKRLIYTFVFQPVQFRFHIPARFSFAIKCLIPVAKCIHSKSGVARRSRALVGIQSSGSVAEWFFEWGNNFHFKY